MDLKKHAQLVKEFLGKQGGEVKDVTSCAREPLSSHITNDVAATLVWVSPPILKNYENKSGVYQQDRGRILEVQIENSAENNFYHIQKQYLPQFELEIGKKYIFPLVSLVPTKLDPKRGSTIGASYDCQKEITSLLVDAGKLQEGKSSYGFITGFLRNSPLERTTTIDPTDLKSALDR